MNSTQIDQFIITKFLADWKTNGKIKNDW